MSRGLGDVYKRQASSGGEKCIGVSCIALAADGVDCLLYTSDAADE